MRLYQITTLRPVIVSTVGKKSDLMCSLWDKFKIRWCRQSNGSHGYVALSNGEVDVQYGINFEKRRAYAGKPAQWTAYVYVIPFTYAVQQGPRTFAITRDGNAAKQQNLNGPLVKFHDFQHHTAQRVHYPAA